MKNDILSLYKENIDFKSLNKERKFFKEKIKKSKLPFITPQNTSFLKRIKKYSFETDTQKNKIITKDIDNFFLNKNNLKYFNKIVMDMAPWRIGPYKIGPFDIESEWNSYYKFNRLKNILPNIKNRKVADVGGNNGYFSFKLSSYNPKLILNLEPGIKSYVQFELLQNIFKIPNIQHEPIKAEDINIFKGFFDVIFCLGVIYHQRNPLLMLNKMWEALSKEGTLVLETICFDSKEQVCLCPNTYSKMRNVWFLPSPSCLKRWLEVSNFKIISESTLSTTTFKEQRKTKHAFFESLEDFLDPKNIHKTVEGYNAPKRYIVVAKKKNN